MVGPLVFPLVRVPYLRRPPVPWVFIQSMVPNIDMIGEHEIDALELQIGHGHVVYTGGAKGTDELVEQMAKHFGMQVEVLVPLTILERPSSPRPPWKSSC